MPDIISVKAENIYQSYPKVEGNGVGDCAMTHTPCPKPYVAWGIWAEEKSKTHNQVKCPHCGLLAVWVEK